MLKAKFSKEEIYFKGNSLEEQLLASEAVHAENVKEYEHLYEVNEAGHLRQKKKYVDELKWHSLITRSIGDFKDHPTPLALKRWGLEIDEMTEVRHILRSRRQKYLRDNETLEEFMFSKHYQNTLREVQNLYNKPLKDGSKFFDYQKQGIAYIAARKRLVLGFDMGLGKTRTTLAGLTANPANKKILIVTMSRNISDWLREMDILGLSDEYIEIHNKEDMKSDKRIHIVSYERWAKESIIFKDKNHEKCPKCTMNYYWKSNLQYCGFCKKRPEKLEEKYTIKDLPENCPCCQQKWKKGSMFCACGFTVIKSRKRALFSHMNRSYDAAAIDEAHLIKNGDTRRTKSILSIKTKTRIALTGTPAENGASDVFWILSWIIGDSHVFEDPFENEKFNSFGKKGQEHFRSYYGGDGSTAVFDANRISARATHHEELWDLMDRVMLRKRKTDDDVESDIRVPEPRHRRIHLTLEEAERKLYESKLEEFKEWYQLEVFKKEQAIARGTTYRISTIEVCSWLDKLRKTASCSWIDPAYDISLPGEPEKLRFTKEKIKEFSRLGKKLIIFTAHKQTAEQLGVMLDSIVPGQRAAYIHGEIPMKFRHELMKQFQDPHNSLSVLVMTMRTGAESYTLTEAKGVILFDLDFNAKKIEQCYSRAVRLGQLDVVDVYWLIGVDTIDANMHALVLSKKSGVDLAIDREALNFDAIAKEFESNDATLFAPGVNYELFATEMLARGTSREKYIS